MTEKKKVVVAFRIEQDTKRELEEIAALEHRLPSSVMRLLLEIGLEEYRKAQSRAGSGSNLLQLLDRK
jgi:predicted transcriptional regulator